MASCSQLLYYSASSISNLEMIFINGQFFRIESNQFLESVKNQEVRTPILKYFLKCSLRFCSIDNDNFKIQTFWLEASKFCSIIELLQKIYNVLKMAWEP